MARTCPVPACPLAFHTPGHVVEYLAFNSTQVLCLFRVNDPLPVRPQVSAQLPDQIPLAFWVLFHGCLQGRLYHRPIARRDPLTHFLVRIMIRSQTLAQSPS